MKLTILLISILLIGCSKQAEIECKNITINNTIDTIKYVNVTVIKEVNITCDETLRELDLIRRIKFLEGQQNKCIINETECMPHNVTEEDLEKCEDRLDTYEDDIDELDDELDDCEDELCEYNSTEC